MSNFQATCSKTGSFWKKVANFVQLTFQVFFNNFLGHFEQVVDRANRSLVLWADNGPNRAFQKQNILYSKNEVLQTCVPQEYAQLRQNENTLVADLCPFSIIAECMSVERRIPAL